MFCIEGEKGKRVTGSRTRGELANYLNLEQFLPVWSVKQGKNWPCERWEGTYYNPRKRLPKSKW
ncbi:hypothetical protein IMCC1989_1940 [gamma proteobacterium IMCC1989]|nr:hypothetical protein IMCC1989_1940 [gamma proteobacterium IMCC1989]